MTIYSNTTRRTSATSGMNIGPHAALPDADVLQNIRTNTTDKLRNMFSRPSRPSSSFLTLGLTALLSLYAFKGLAQETDQVINIWENDGVPITNGTQLVWNYTARNNSNVLPPSKDCTEVKLFDLYIHLLRLHLVIYLYFGQEILVLVLELICIILHLLQEVLIF